MSIFILTKCHSFLKSLYYTITIRGNQSLEGYNEQSSLEQKTSRQVAGSLSARKRENTGWARSLLLLYSARLKDAQMAYENLLSMQKNLLCQNLMVMHPSTRGAQSFMEVYEFYGKPEQYPGSKPATGSNCRLAGKRVNYQKR